MERQGYTDTDAHVEAHRALLQSIVDLKLQIDTGQTRVYPGIYDFLRSWFTEHTLQMDRPLAMAMEDFGATNPMELMKHWEASYPVSSASWMRHALRS